MGRRASRLSTLRRGAPTRTPRRGAARRRARTARAVLVGAAILVALLAVAQLALPRLAEDELRDRLGGAQEVASVDVRALPAVQLLWRHADRVEARVRSYDAAGVDVADELAETAGVARLDVEIARVRATPDLLLRDVRLRKRDGLLELRAVADRAALAGALGDRLGLLLAVSRLLGDPRIDVEHVGATPLPGDRVALRGRLRIG